MAADARCSFRVAIDRRATPLSYNTFFSHSFHEPFFRLHVSHFSYCLVGSACVHVQVATRARALGISLFPPPYILHFIISYDRVARCSVSLYIVYIPCVGRARASHTSNGLTFICVSFFPRQSSISILLLLLALSSFPVAIAFLFVENGICIFH